MITVAVVDYQQQAVSFEPVGIYYIASGNGFWLSPLLDLISMPFLKTGILY